MVKSQLFILLLWLAVAECLQLKNPSSNMKINNVFLQYSKRALISRLRDRTSPGGEGGNTFVPLATGPDCEQPQLLILGGYTETELEAIDDVVDAVITQKDGRIIPSIVLGEGDKSKKLSYFLTEKVVQERDHELPDNAIKIPTPLVIFSGLQAVDIRNLMHSIRETIGSRSDNNGKTGKQKKMIFAVVVKNALEKSIEKIYSEVLNDFEANTRR